MRAFLRHFDPVFQLAAVLLLASCGNDFALPERQAGQRVGRALECDPADLTRCALPWPSDAFLRLDPATATGVRVALPLAALTIEDDPSYLNRADGFSRLTPIMTGLPVRAPESLLAAQPLRLLCAEPGEAFGSEAALRLRIVESRPKEAEESLLIGYPRRPLRAGSEYVAVVLDPAPLAAERHVRLAMGLAEPESREEAEVVARHAPARRVLAQAGIDAGRVRRVWTFVTRSAADPVRRLQAMRAAAESAVGAATPVRLTRLVPGAKPEIAAVVEGWLGGLPSFTGTAGGLTLGADGLPQVLGAHEAPFRVVVPAGSGNYPMVVFGHGTGGDFTDADFDDELAQRGYGKLGVRFEGLDKDDVVTTATTFIRMLAATERVGARLMESLADAAAVQRALAGPIGDALAADEIAGVANPARGRRPDASAPVWAGGSLGGTMGLVVSSADPSIRHAVLNVPGAGWSHFVGLSQLFVPAVSVFLAAYGTRLDFEVAFLQAQLPFDDVDGGNWVGAVPGHSPMFLVQESIGDPVMANIGTDLVASAVDAVHVGAPIVPIPGIEQAEQADGRSALTQYRVPEGTDAVDTHGFAAKDGPAGRAAREQISEFLRSVRAGAPRISLPSACVAKGGSCDFSGP